jgi:hypothetical protein
MAEGKERVVKRYEVVPWLNWLKSSDIIVTDLLCKETRRATLQETTVFKTMPPPSSDELKWFRVVDGTWIYLEVHELQDQGEVDPRVRLLPPGNELQYLFHFDEGKELVSGHFVAFRNV